MLTQQRTPILHRSRDGQVQQLNSELVPAADETEPLTTHFDDSLHNKKPIAATVHRRTLRVSLTRFIPWTVVSTVALVVVVVTGVYRYGLGYCRQQEQPLPVLFSQCGIDHIVEGRDNKKTASPCVLFNPKTYFSHLELSSSQLLQNASMNDIPKLSMWGLYVSDFYPSTSTATSLPSSQLSQQGIASVSTVMMPKVASRTIEALFLQQLSHPSSQPRVGHATRTYWKRITQRSRSDMDILFAVVRNPTQRFLSSLAQTLSTPMMRGNSRCAQALQPCVDSSATYPELVQCVVRSMMIIRESSVFFNVHVVPQTAFLYGMVRHVDRDMVVVDYDHGGLDVVLQTLGGSAGCMDEIGPYSTSSALHKNKRTEKEYGSTVEMKFGSALRATQRGTTTTFLNESIVAEICELYRVDVQLIQYLGWRVEECE